MSSILRSSKVLARRCLGGLLLFCFSLGCWAGDLDTMGVTLLRASHANLTGTGIDVAQAEAMVAPGAFEVNPFSVGEPTSLFQWISTNGAYTGFTNSAGVESSHADQVANAFYGPNSGVAPGVIHVDNYEADYFFGYVIDAAPAPAISNQVVNESFAFFTTSASDQETVDTAYDDYIYNNGNVFASAPNGVNSGVGPPGTAYNCIGVGAYGVGAVTTDGPTIDNGRSKPDICAPGTETSFTTPYVAGAAAVLMQAGGAGYGGSSTTQASNAMTVKALLLNGALKPFNWANTTTAPLDRRYGAGVMNLYYSFQQLAGGKHAYSAENNVSSGAAHPPISGTTIAASSGWDYETVNLGLLLGGEDTINHYIFNVTSNSTLTATLVWERHADQSAINNLGLFLYNATNSVLVTSSVSSVDNVQHVYIPHLPPGKYDLQVVYYYATFASLSENYALAFQFYPMAPPGLSVTAAGTNDIITWPSSPTVYTLQQTSSLSAPVTWNNISATQWITNTTVWTTVPNTGGDAYFRLVR